MDEEEMEEEVYRLSNNNSHLQENINEMTILETDLRYMKDQLNSAKGKIANGYSIYVSSYVSDNKDEEKKIHSMFTDSVKTIRARCEDIDDLIENEIRKKIKEYEQKYEENVRLIKYYCNELEWSYTDFI